MSQHVPETAAGYTAADNVLVRLRAQLPELTGAIARVAETVLADPAAAARATIVELAERSGTSPATVTRFCRALGFEGYADLRLGIAAETGRAARAAGWTVDIGREILPSDPLDRVLEHIIAADARAIHDTAARLDLAAVGRAATALAAAKRVDIYGIGGSALVGAEMQLCLHRIGIPSWSWTEVHNGLASAALLRTGDVALGISHSGQTRETIEMLAEAGSHGATTVAVTSFPRSPLAELADIVLTTAAQTTTFRPDALSARHPQLLVLDLVFVAVAQRTHDHSHAAFQVTVRAVAGHRADERPVEGRRRTRAVAPTAPAAPAATTAQSATAPGEIATDRRPGETADDRRPAETASDGRPAETASDGRPAEIASDRRPAEIASDRQPADIATDRQPAKEATA